jgi:hypothetical protein
MNLGISRSTREAGIEENMILIFASENGPEATHPWEVTADHGAVRISQQWKPHYVRRSLSDGQVKFQLALPVTRSSTL